VSGVARVARARVRVRRVGWGDLALRGWTVAVFAFLFAPIVVAIVYAFNRGQLGKQSVTFTGFTTHWFAMAWQDTTLRSAVGSSLKVAVAVALLSTVLGTVTGIAVVRHPSRTLRSALQAVVLLLIIVPEVVLAVSLIVFFTKLHVPLGIFPLIAGHTPFTIAVVAVIIRARVLIVDREMEHAATDLGADPLRMFRDILLPQLRPAILAGLILSFTFSFDDLLISEFLTSPRVTTLPVYLFGSTRVGVTPAVYATATMMFVSSAVLLVLGGVVYTRQARRAREESTG
jgi:ABC-type spermidine/putrescine transport system permease subunit II